MKLSKIMVLFGIVLPVSVVLRLFQILYTVDFSTGFFKREETGVGLFLGFFIAACCIALAVFSRFSFRTPQIREKNIPVAIGSLLCAAALIYELLSESFSGTVLTWQLTLLSVTGAAAVLFFIGFGFSKLVSFSLPPIVLIIPPIYFVVRIICAFTLISSLSLIFDHALLMAVYCVGLLFFMHLGKQYNEIDPDRTFRKLLGSGLCFVLLCAAEGLPYFAVNNLLKIEYRHTSFAANLSVLAFGLFAATVLATHFLFQASED